MENEKIGNLVSKDYRKADVFKQFGLDFCCGGGTSVAQACIDKGIDKDELIGALRKVESDQPGPTVNYDNFTPGKLCDYIVEKHHSYVTDNLALITEYAIKVAKVHGKSDPELETILSLWEALSEELSMHSHKEEFILFPYIKELEQKDAKIENLAPPPFGSITHPVSMMEFEHDQAGEILKTIRSLSNDFTPPEHACNTYKVFYSKLSEFEEDLHFHIHLENNILFPKAIKLEKK